MSRVMDSLDRLLKQAAAADPGAQAMAAAAQTAGAAPGAVPAPAMPASETPPDNSADVSKLQNEVGKRDKEIADLRAKVQDAKNQAALVEMKQQMAEEREKMRDELRKEYTQMQDKLRGQQKELDARQAQFVQEEANHKSRLAEIASGHKATLQQQIAEQKVTLAQNEAKSLQEIADMRSKSQQDQAQQYVAMTEKARRDADRMMQEKEKSFAAKHPALHPILQGRINDATSAIARLSKKNNLGFSDGIKLAAAQPQQQQAAQPQPQQQRPKFQMSKAMQMRFDALNRKPSGRTYTAAELDEAARQKRRMAALNMQFNGDSGQVADASMAVARAENALARAKAEGRTSEVQDLEQYIRQTKMSGSVSAHLQRGAAQKGSNAAKADIAINKAQSKGGLFGGSELDKVRNQWQTEQNDKNRSWLSRAGRFVMSPVTAVGKGIDNAVRGYRVNKAFGAESNWFSGGTTRNSALQGAYNQFMENTGLPQSIMGQVSSVAVPVADLAMDAAALATTVGTFGAGAPLLAARIAAKQGLKHAVKTVGMRTAREVGKRAVKTYLGNGLRQTGKAITGMLGRDTSNYGQTSAGLGSAGAGYYDSASGQYMNAAGGVRNDSYTSDTSQATRQARIQRYGY